MKDFILPDIGEGIVECEIVEWHVNKGDTISEDQPVCDVMTDKALVEIPSVYSGKVAQLYYKKGDMAKVHAPLFSIDIECGGKMDNASVLKTKEKNTGAEKVSVNTASVEEFILPDIGEGITECEVVEWLVNEGDQIEEDQAVCDLMTDKALVQIPSKNSGTVVKQHYKKGDIAAVHSPLFSISVDKKPDDNKVCSDLVNTSTSVETKSNSATETVNKNTADLHNPVTQKKAISSPSVRRIAREMSIDLTQVPGSGEKGRIYKEDVIAFKQGKGSGNGHPVENRAIVTTGGIRKEPVTGMMAKMAKHMTDAVQSIPHFTFCEEIDVTALSELRACLKKDYEQSGIKLTMMPFFIKALSLALKAFPQINVQANDECTQLSYFNDHNIGMAVDSKLGLLVPNIKQCQNKSIKNIAEEMAELIGSAKEGRVSPDSLKGGTITISNIGALGGTVATPIINKPEAAIVALGRMQKLPRFNDKGEVQARQIMQVSWSADHRIIDGATITRFNNKWKGYLENPATMVAELI